MGFNSGFKGLN